MAKLGNLTQIDWSKVSPQGQAAVLVRTNAIPLDRYEIYYSYADALAYAEENPVAHAGQTIKVVSIENNTVDIYKIRPDRTLEKVGSDVAADLANVTADIQKIQKSTGSWDNSAAYLASNSASLNSTVDTVNASASVWSAAEQNAKDHADEKFNQVTASLNAFTASQATVNQNLLASASTAESTSKAYADQKFNSASAALNAYTASQAEINANLVASASTAEQNAKDHADQKFNQVTASLNDYSASMIPVINNLNSTASAHEERLAGLDKTVATHSNQIAALESSASAIVSESATHMKLDGSNSNIAHPLSFASGAAQIKYDSANQCFEFIFN